jgi:electron transfer flavoprotein beta subunit
MNIVVLIGGVHDPKWPITAEAALDDSAGEHRTMSPFDEAALELALRVRDADPEAEIAVRVAGGQSAMRIARAAAALNICDVAILSVERAWDQAAVARAIAPLCDGADLILIGREFGDFDDGLVPALLAEMVAVPYFARAQTIETRGGIRLMRETGNHCETLELSGRLLASATNDRRTRLRKPLMKNVMQARQATIREYMTQGEAASHVSIESLAQRTNGRRRTDCSLVEGPADQQAQALALLLWEARA